MVSDSPSAASPSWSAWFQRAGWFARTLPLWLALAVSLSFQGTRGLHETSETRYAECAREMLVSGNWLEPQLDFAPHWTKPPFTYWAMAAGMKVFGVNSWGVRVPAVLTFVLATWAVLLAGRRLGGEVVGFVSALIFAVGLLPAAGSHIVTADTFLCSAMACAGAAFVFAATETDPARRRRYTWLMWALFGWAFLVKGPPALLPLLALIPWTMLQPREKRVPLASPIGLLLFVAVGFSWYFAMLARHSDLLKYYVEREVVARVAGGEGHNPEWYTAFTIYGPALLLGLGGAGIVALFHVLVRAGWLRVERWKQLWQSRDSRLLLVLWVALPLVIFSLSKSKLHFYVLPLMVPLAWMAGSVLARRSSPRAVGICVAFSIILLVGGKGFYAYKPDRRDMRALGAEVQTARAPLPPGHAIAIWDEARNHGLTFYLALQPPQLLERIAREDPKEKFERWSVPEFAAQAVTGYPQGALIVVSERKRADFDAHFPRLKISAETKGRYWHLLQLAPAAPIAGSHP